MTFAFLATAKMKYLLYRRIRWASSKNFCLQFSSHWVVGWRASSHHAFWLDLLCILALHSSLHGENQAFRIVEMKLFHDLWINNRFNPNVEKTKFHFSHAVTLFFLPSRPPSCTSRSRHWNFSNIKRTTISNAWWKNPSDMKSSRSFVRSYSLWKLHFQFSISFAHTLTQQQQCKQVIKIWI